MHETLFDRIADIVARLGTGVGAVLAGLVALWGAVKFVRHGFNVARLSQELALALEAGRDAASAARSYRLAAEGYRERIDSMIEDMKGATERANAATERADTALVYIVDLINFAQSGRPFSEMPRLPESLETDIYQIIWKRAQSFKPEVPKAGRPFYGSLEEGAGP